MTAARSNSKWLRYGTLGLLYFVQGAPYGFQTACLPLILRQAGLSYTELGAMKLLFLPWVCKPLYAPFVERTRTKKWWLVLSMSLLGGACLLAGTFVEIGNLFAVSLILFTFNLLAATQDISVDSLAVHALAPEELGAGNTIQVVSYKFGSVFAGGILLWVEQIVGWTGMFVCFSLIYFISVFLLCHLNLVEKSSRRSSYDSNKHEDDFSNHSPSIVSSFKVSGTAWMVSFVLFYKLCERAEQTFSLFMVDKKVPMAKLALWSTIMRVGSLVGSTYGGWALSGNQGVQTAPNDIILSFSLIRCVSIFCQLVLVILWGQAPIESDEFVTMDWIYIHLSFILLCITLFSAGALTTATFTLMMRLSQTAPKALKGTHYTVLSTCEVFGKLVFAIIAGWLTDVFGLQIVYSLFVMLAVLNIPFILKMPVPIARLCKTQQCR